MKKLKSKILLPIVVLFTMFFTISAVSHDNVLIANNFIVKKGEKLIMRYFVTWGFNVISERPMENTVRSLKITTEKGTKNLMPLTKEGAVPFVATEVDFNGLGLIEAEKDYSFISIENKEFKEYLEADHIENITIDESKKEQTERYARFIKSLVQSGPVQNDDLYKKIVGHPYEIILLQNPYQLKKGDWFKAQVFINGKPMVGKVIVARNRVGGELPTYQLSRTDDKGVCSFKLDREGDWTITTTHLFPSRDKSKSDWESYWASYSFGTK
ncbi:MAG: DUF4198 domain-containing protein [Cloacibacterium sp.]|jgi:uncharacterized GH25 family protein|nr:DUF4198 domain-containing protein [Cloacibacterium sp.]